MEPTALKSSVLDAARKKLEETAADLKERIKDLRSVTIGDDNAESASQTESTRGSDVELMNSLGEQLDHVQADMARVTDINPSVRLDVVQYGAVVHTEKHHFLIAASIEDFIVDGTHYLGVSTKAPLIQALSGLKKGEKVDFQENTYTIKEIL